MCVCVCARVCVCVYPAMSKYYDSLGSLTLVWQLAWEKKTLNFNNLYECGWGPPEGINTKQTSHINIWSRPKPYQLKALSLSLSHTHTHTLTHTHKKNSYRFILKPAVINTQTPMAQSAGAAEYTDSISAKR